VAHGEAGIRHIVRSSGLGADAQSAASLARLQGTIDALVADSGIAHTFIRPAGFMQNWVNHSAAQLKAGIYCAPDGNGAQRLVDTRDIAESAAAILTNPAAHATGPSESLLERLQRAHPSLRLVKAFNSVGAGLMVQPRLAGGRPTMFIAGDDAAAKTEVSRVLESFGWEADVIGAAVAARAIEPLAMLWCIPGFLRNDWSHALRMLRPG
jgi:hypothetical protein